MVLEGPMAEGNGTGAFQQQFAFLQVEAVVTSVQFHICPVCAVVDQDESPLPEFDAGMRSGYPRIDDLDVVMALPSHRYGRPVVAHDNQSAPQPQFQVQQGGSSRQFLVDLFRFDPFGFGPFPVWPFSVWPFQRREENTSTYHCIRGTE